MSSVILYLAQLYANCDQNCRLRISAHDSSIYILKAEQTILFIVTELFSEAIVIRQTSWCSPMVCILNNLRVMLIIVKI